MKLFFDAPQPIIPYYEICHCNNEKSTLYVPANLVGAINLLRGCLFPDERPE
jgi:hypothetical protein